LAYAALATVAYFVARRVGITRLPRLEERRGKRDENDGRSGLPALATRL